MSEIPGFAGRRKLAIVSYRATETLSAGWELTDVVCNDTDSIGDIGKAIFYHDRQLNERFLGVVT